VGFTLNEKMEGNLKMIHTARIINVLKRYFKRLMPGKTETLVRMLADEGRVKKQADPAFDRLNQAVKTRPATTGGGIQADWQTDGYPAAFRNPVSSRKNEIVPKKNLDIDLVGLDDLEACAEELTLPAESIESWVGAGILSPRETEIAERLIRIIRARDQKREHQNTLR
jgi:hypothetical protein